MVVENSFGILAARWRIFLTSIIADLELTKKIVEAGVILHNFLMTQQDWNNITPDLIRDNEIVPGNWRNDGEMTPFNQEGSNNFTHEAADIRNEFMQYFEGEGAVPWQDSRI